MKKKIHAVINRSNISMERYSTNVPISRDPLVIPGQTACLDSVIPYKDAVIQTVRRDKAAKVGDQEVITPLEMHRFMVREEGYYVCDRDCKAYPDKCTGIKISQVEFWDDTKTAEELFKKYSDKREAVKSSA